MSAYRLGIRRGLAAAAAVAAVAASVAGAALFSQSREVDHDIRSVALAGRVHARVILPAGYDDSPHRRYPVVYFLHGLPATSTSYRGNNWLLAALDAAGSAILVLPQGARDVDNDPEYLDWGQGRNWATFVSTELVHHVDTHFRTIAARNGRAIVGLSAGGYGATIIGLSHLDRFSVIESWSGYFHPTDPTGTKALARGPLTVARRLIPALHRQAARRPTFLAFYVGKDDSRFAADNIRFDRELRATKTLHTFAVYPGGHDPTLWEGHARSWLSLALSRLRRPTP